MTTPRTSKATRHKPKAASDAKPVEPRVKPSLHPRNRHQGRYDFPQLISVCPELAEFVEGLDIGADAKARLVALTPATYTGLADRLVDEL